MAEKVVYNDPTPNNFPDDYDESKVDSRVKIRSKSIAHKKFGEHVREALMQGLEIAGVVATEATETASAAYAKSTDTQNRLKDQLAAATDANDDLSEVTDARRPANADETYKTIGERMDANDQASQAIAEEVDISTSRALLSFLNSKMINIGGMMPDYYQSRLADFSTIPTNNFNVGFITDNHFQLSTYAPNSLAHYSYIAAASRIARLDAIIAGGDNTNGYFTKQQKIVETQQVTSTLFNLTNPDTDVFFELGNHDNGVGQNGNNTPATTLSEAELKDLYQASSLSYSEIRDGDSLYGYKDYPDKKVRLIWLNSFDLPYTLNTDGTFKYNFLQQSSYRNSQLVWLATKALLLPDNTWQVMIFTHCPLPGTFEVANGQAPLSQFNSDALISILQAFQGGSILSFSDDNREFPVILSADYSVQGAGVLIGLFSGHVHADGQMIYEGINCIETSCSLCHTGDVGRFKNTETEDCWDIFSVDTAARKIHAYRFGFGTDRDFTY